jgi:hypothetical protein
MCYCKNPDIVVTVQYDAPAVEINHPEWLRTGLRPGYRYQMRYCTNCGYGEIYENGMQIEEGPGVVFKYPKIFIRGR